MTTPRNTVHPHEVLTNAERLIRQEDMALRRCEEIKADRLARKKMIRALKCNHKKQKPALVRCMDCAAMKFLLRHEKKEPRP